MSMTAMVNALRKLGTLAEEAAKAAAPVVLKSAQLSVAAGKTPDGEAWAPKKDGGRALVHAANALSCAASGTVVELKLSGVEVIHNYGTKLGAARQELQGKGGKEVAALLERGKRNAAKRELQARKSIGFGRSKAQYAGAFHTPPRQIIPEAGSELPDAYAAAMQRGAEQAFRKIVGG